MNDGSGFTWSYVIAIVFPIGGLIVGLALLARPDKREGVGVIFTSLVAGLIWIALVTSLG